MDIHAATATLTPAEIALVKDADRKCDAVNRALGQATARRDALGAGAAVFDESLRLKNTLDAYEARANSKPSWDTLAVLVNCEYRLYVLNQATPLRNNPFLSHWVEAVQRLSPSPNETGHAPSPALATSAPAGAAASPTSPEIHTVRVELIKALLQSRNPSQFARASPRRLYGDHIEFGQVTPLDISPYVRMLEEEGIYERTPSPTGSSKSPSPPPPQRIPLGAMKPLPNALPFPHSSPRLKSSIKHTPAPAPAPVPAPAPTQITSPPPDPPATDFHTWKTAMLSRLASASSSSPSSSSSSPSSSSTKAADETAAALHQLTHLPLDLPSLDFLTTLLESRTLPRSRIDPAPVVADFIQHALRSVEAMGTPLSSSTLEAGGMESRSGSGEEATHLRSSYPPPREASGTSSPADPLLIPTPSQLSGGGGGADTGRAAQIRAVKLLLLFMRNLLRKDLVPAAAIYFEIQEVCVRYVWMREVREFRAFVEGGGVVGVEWENGGGNGANSNGDGKVNGSGNGERQVTPTERRENG